MRNAFMSPPGAGRGQGHPAEFTWRGGEGLLLTRPGSIFRVSYRIFIKEGETSCRHHLSAGNSANLEAFGIVLGVFYVCRFSCNRCCLCFKRYFQKEESPPSV